MQWLPTDVRKCIGETIGWPRTRQVPGSGRQRAHDQYR